VTYAAKQTVHVSTPAVSVGIPILASKITAPKVAEWVVARPRITDRPGDPLVPADGCQRAGRRGQDDGAGGMGGGPIRPGDLGQRG